MPAWIAIIACGLMLAAHVASARAGTIRHDRGDSFYRNLAAEPSFAAVGKITGGETGGGFLASGTLVRDQWVLTAAHVVDGVDGFGAGITNLQFQVGGATFTSETWFVHPDWIASGGESNLFAGWDLALVRLNKPVSNVTPVSLFTGSNELGQVSTIVGFGATGTGLTGAQTNTAGVKRAGNNVVDISGTLTTSGSTVSIGHERMLAIDFDRPAVPSESTLGSPLPLDLEYLTAPGDSGGGLFVEVDGQHLLAGVTSLGSTLDQAANSDYGDRAAFTRVSQFVSWIDETIAANSVLAAPILPGDFDLDSDVDGADFLAWQRGFGATFDDGDLVEWRSNFGANGVAGAHPGTTAVPQPEPLALLLIGVAGVMVGRVGRKPRSVAERPHVALVRLAHPAVRSHWR